MSSRSRGVPGRIGLPALVLLVPVLLGLLVMHGGLSAWSADHPAHGTAEQLSAVATTATDKNGRHAAAESISQLPMSLPSVQLNPSSHGGHAGQMCLAFLRSAALVLLTLLTGRVRRWATGRVTAPSPCSSGRGRAPPRSSVSTRPPSLVFLCVLRL